MKEFGCPGISIQVSKTSLDFILAMGVNDHDNIIDNIKNKENLRLQLNSLKNKLF